MSKWQYQLVLLALISFVAGCTESAPLVSGDVTYEGKPVASGRISFNPVGGQGTPFGGLIKDGSYTTDTAYVGKRLVVISAKNEIKFNGREMIMPTEGKPGDDLIPENAVGNMQEVEIKGGSQTLDFHLKAPQ
jgi:hypothetical protein